MKNADLNLGSLGKQLADVGHTFKRYAGVSFFLLLALAYAFVVMRINTLSDVQISDADVAAQVNASPTARIDERAITQLKSLNDNSVNVQTLFQQSRTNPFQE